MKRSARMIFTVGLLCGVSYSQPKHSMLSFHPAIQLPVGTQPCYVILADVNHDGNKDIITANSGSANVSVYLGNGKGDFIQAKGSPFPAGENPNDIAVGDVNEDSNPDLAFPNHGVKLVTVLLGDGKGSFAPAPGSPFSVQSTPHPHGIALADFNGDKKMDIAVESWGENKIITFLGNGDGTFQTPGNKFNVGTMPYQRLRSADLNEDGFADIVTSNFEEHSVSVLLGDGKGNFSPAAGKNVSVPENPFGIALGDVNGDRHQDIVIVHYSGHESDPGKDGLSVLYGDGKGNFTLAKGSPFRTGHYPSTVAVGDVDGDGIMDIAVPNVVNKSVTIYLGGKTGIKEVSGSPFSIGHGPHCVALGDLNGDGLADIITADLDDNELTVLLSIKK